MEISLQLFGDSRKYPSTSVRNKLQSRVLTSFLNSGVNEKQHSESELFLHELMVFFLILNFFKLTFQTQGSPYARDDITFLKCIRMLMGMSKRRYGKTNLHLVVKPRVFREKEFCHHSNPNYDPFFVTALIVKTSELKFYRFWAKFNLFSSVRRWWRRHGVHTHGLLSPYYGDNCRVCIRLAQVPRLCERIDKNDRRKVKGLFQKLIFHQTLEWKRVQPLRWSW